MSGLKKSRKRKHHHRAPKHQQTSKLPVQTQQAPTSQPPSETLKQQFSSSQTAGQSTGDCPVHKPCNLIVLKVVEPHSGCEGGGGRSGEIRMNQKLNREATPVLLGQQDTFQITAPSPLRNEPRELEISVQSAPACPAKKHPYMRWQESGKDGRKEEEKLTNNVKVSYFRRQLRGDTERSFFFMLNSAFIDPDIYTITGESCGNPKPLPGVPAPKLVARIEVFPADEFTASFTLPPVSKKDLVDKQSKSWEETKKHEQQEELKKAGEKADSDYENKHSDEFRKEISKQDFHDFEVNREKAKIGFHEENESDLSSAGNIVNGLKIKLTQKDGDNSLDANFDDIIKLYRLKTNAIYTMREIYSWIEKCPQPPGASFKIDADFLTGSLSAQWGQKEYTDNRVFMAIKGKFSLELFKISLDANLGIKAGGLADAFVFLRAEGAITLSASIARDRPDEVAPPQLDVSGEVKVSGGLQGQLMWVVKVQGKVETTFVAETDGLVVFKKHGLLSGSVTLKRDDVTRTVTTSCWLFGESTEKTVLVKESHTKFPMRKTSGGEAK